MKTSTRKPKRDSRISSLPLRIKSILVPLDFSAPSRKALAFAVSLARLFKAKLTVLHVVEPAATPEMAALVWEDEKSRAVARTSLAQLLETTHVPRRLVETTLVRFGRAFHEITEAARTRKVDLIVISTHGHTGLKRALLGSTTERVVRHASCPVFVVRQR